MQSGGQSPNVPAAQGRGHLLAGLGGWLRGEFVEAPEDRRRGQAPRGEGEDPQVPAPGHQRGEAIPASVPDGGGAQEREGDVGAEAGRQCLQVLGSEAGAPQGVARRQRRRGVGGSAGHATGHGHALAHDQVDALIHAGRLRQQARRAHGEVGAVGGHTGIGLLKAQRDTAPLEAGLAAGGDRLDEPHRLENGGQRVVAIGAGGADGQEQVDLPGRLDPHGRGGAGPGR